VKLSFGNQTEKMKEIKDWSLNKTLNHTEKIIYFDPLKHVWNYVRGRTSSNISSL